MSEKYYTPTINEFHVGFEYQWRHNDDWNNGVIKDGTQIDDINNPVYELRVKYLDQEDIECCGWKFTGKSIDIWFTKEVNRTPGGRHPLVECKLHYNLEDHELHINGYFGGEDEGCFFEGFINNKSELLKIMQQLNLSRAI